MRALTRKSGPDSLLPLVKRTLGGDRRAQRELLEALSVPIRRQLRRLLASDADVEDALQESLLSVLGALPGFRGESTVLTFALGIALHQGVARRRSLERRHVHERELSRLESPLAAAPRAPDDLTLTTRSQSALTQILQALPVAQADAVVQRVALDCSPSEIAARDGISSRNARRPCFVNKTCTSAVTRW